MNLSYHATFKRCLSCKQDEPLANFGHKKGVEHGSPICRACNRLRSRSSYNRRKDIQKVNYEKAPSKYVVDLFTGQGLRIQQLMDDMSKIKDSHQVTLHLFCQANPETSETAELLWIQTERFGLFLFLFKGKLSRIARSGTEIVRYVFTEGFIFKENQPLKFVSLPKLTKPLSWHELGITSFRPSSERNHF